MNLGKQTSLMGLWAVSGWDWTTSRVDRRLTVKSGDAGMSGRQSIKMMKIMVDP